MSLLDLDERLVELISLGLELTATPITDLKEPPPGTDVGIIEGAVGNSHQEEEVRLFRERCRIIVAIGDCAVFGGISTMRNYTPVEEVLRRGYVTTESTVDGRIPGSPELGRLLPRVKAVNEVVKVDFYIPGCPPPADAIYHVLKALLQGKIPRLSGELLRYE
jgi:NAD-reducing hydrogenase small subunit